MDFGADRDSDSDDANFIDDEFENENKMISKNVFAYESQKLRSMEKLQ